MPDYNLEHEVYLAYGNLFSMDIGRDIVVDDKGSRFVFFLKYKTQKMVFFYCYQIYFNNSLLIDINHEIKKTYN